MRYAASDDAKTEDRGYLHAYALRFTLNGELFSFVCLPDEGERFLSHECIQQLTLWSEPWALF
jgi:tRNA pseudouridine32 synthase/23S rRNA pseudouridine746 synthase